MKCSKFVIWCVCVLCTVCVCVWIFYHLNSRWFMGIGYLIKPHSGIRDQNQTIKNSRICRPMKEREREKFAWMRGKMYMRRYFFFLLSLLVINCQCLRFCFWVFGSFWCCSQHFNRSIRVNGFTADTDT